MASAVEGVEVQFVTKVVTRTKLKIVSKIRNTEVLQARRGGECDEAGESTNPLGRCQHRCYQSPIEVEAGKIK